MSTHQLHQSSPRWSFIGRAAVLLTLSASIAALTQAGAASSAGSAAVSPRPPSLAGRAVLPYDTLAEGPPAGAFMPTTQNGVDFPLPSQPVEGFSGIIDGHRRGEYLAMEDNGFGSKANSRDFLIRAYFIRPQFKTSHGGSGAVRVGDFISFRDPDHKLAFPIVNESTRSRLLTGADIDPESLQRGPNGDLWVGDEFGPWLLHFDRHGRLLDAPYEVAGVKSPNNPTLNGAAPTQPNSRGFEAIAISPDGKSLYAALEGATVADTDQTRRNIYEFSVHARAFTGRERHYRTESPTNMIADMSALGRNHLVVVERDGGSGVAALFRRVYRVDLRHTEPTGYQPKTQLVDLAAIPDPHGVSLPAIHPGDLGLGDPFRVMCESVEAVHVVGRKRLLVGCDNNLPNSGRNPTRPDDNELIVLRVPDLRRR
jgi:glycerophosphoryl diester phosphodiesterase